MCGEEGLSTCVLLLVPWISMFSSLRVLPPGCAVRSLGCDLCACLCRSCVMSDVSV